MCLENEYVLICIEKEFSCWSIRGDCQMAILHMGGYRQSLMVNALSSYVIRSENQNAIENLTKIHVDVIHVCVSCFSLES
mmetsp:Transcript_651/g.1177  ORF Transcript_651/g.1177 Transcript_651/m.1177 type:complete len:80 (-) Transcript_651:58-297(-)